MENKINIAELLKDCPKGMELDCTMFDDVYFDYIDGESDIIKCYIQNSKHKIGISFNKYGHYSSLDEAKCVIFSKGKTTWEEFVPPRQFKDGDILISGLEDCCNPFIFKQTNGFGNAQCYCAITVFEELILNSDNWTPIKGCRLATEEEKQRLFDAIKANGYKWNTETKTLEKLPKFKVGDRVKKKDSNEDVVLITDIAYNYYIVETKYGMEVTISVSIQNDYELVPDKFDITTLKVFDKVLVRDFDNTPWEIDFFSRLLDGKHFKCVDLSYVQCIPYEKNEYLLGTTDDCDEYYKTW